MTRRFIEDVLPLEELNKYAQKGGGIGSLNAMHPYFARRPLTASRAMTLAALIDAPGSDSERKELEELIVQLSSEEWPDEPKLLARARELIQKTHGGRAPRVLDPFAGGGSMSLEAMRLGCEATALDLNPVAYLALLASLVYPQQYGHHTNGTRPQRIVLKDNSVATNNHKGENRAEDEQASFLDGHVKSQSSLVNDVRYWAEWVLTQAEAEIGDCYPRDDEGAVPVAFLWAKTIVCPHCGGQIPMIKRRWLQSGDGREAVAYRLNVDREAKKYGVEILRGKAAEDDEPERGTMRGATVECIYCGTPSEREKIVDTGQAGGLSQQLLVVVLNEETESGKTFRSANKRDLEAYGLASKKLNEAKTQGYEFWGFERLLSVVPDEPTPHERSRATAIRRYGITEWSQMFNERQLLSLITFGQQIRAVRELVFRETGDREYSQAIALYLDLAQLQKA